MAVEELMAVGTEPATQPAAPTPGRWRVSAVRSFLGLVVGPAAVYVIVRALQIGILKWTITWPGQPGEVGVRAHLREWDSIWFIRVAEHGYPHRLVWPGGNLAQSELPFFPLYPALIRLAHEVTRLPYDVSAYAVSTFAGGVAAVLLFLLGRALYNVSGSIVGFGYAACEYSLIRPPRIGR